MAEGEPVEKKDTTERRVYNLPIELLTRLRAYQTSQNLSSEVEAARRLLDSALQMRDTIEDILERLQARFLEEKDLRVLASEILIKHFLVTNVTFIEGNLTFSLQSGDRGRMTGKGKLYLGDLEYGDDAWLSYPKTPKKPAEAVPVKSGGWDNGGGDLDDEIPFVRSDELYISFKANKHVL